MALWRSVLGTLALTMGLAATAPAQELSWRSSSVQGPRQPGLNTRLGVAFFVPDGPATYERRIVPAGPPQGSDLTINVETLFRFPDGATLTMRSREVIHLTPQGTHGKDEWSGEGEVTGGTGRYAGRNGRFSYRAVMGLDPRNDGVLGDGYLEGRAVLKPAP